MNDLSIKYIFPDYCRIEEIAKAIPNNDLVKEEITNKYILFNKNTKSIFTINDSIRNVLILFSTPKTLLDVKNDIYSETDKKRFDDKVIIDFLQLMVKRKFIIPFNSEILTENNDLGFKNFEIIKTLKKSNFELVCLAKDIVKNKEVVIKALVFGKNSSTKIKIKRRDYFNKEFEIMKELSEHSLICTLNNFYKKKDLAVIEYVEGKTLKELIKNDNIPLNKKIDIIKQIIEVLSFVHKKGIIHGDIHANQFIIKSDMSLKLIDFGLSYYYNSNSNKQIIRRGGIHKYLEPENITSNAFVNVIEYTPSLGSEVYRIGVLLYFIIYESYPFESFSWNRLSKLIKTENPNLKSCTSKGEVVPISVLNVMKKSLLKNPDMRYNSAKEINNELKSI